MNRITEKFAELKKQNKKAFISYVMASDPDLENSKKIVEQLVESGVDIIELGMPFSDPSAEGPTIQKAAQRALSAKGSVKNTLDIVKDFRTKNNTTPIILMGYYNPILNYGIESFAKTAKECGVDGFIIVDLPPEEEVEFTAHSNKHDLCLIRLLTPTTTEERAEKILKSCSGFIYYISVTGVTGVKTAVAEEVSAHIKKIKAKTELPVCVGFGIKSPESAKSFASISDGIIVGSAIIDLIEKDLGNSKNYISNIKNLVSDLSKSIKSI